MNNKESELKRNIKDGSTMAASHNAAIDYNFGRMALLPVDASKRRQKKDDVQVHVHCLFVPCSK